MSLGLLDQGMCVQAGRGSELREPRGRSVPCMAEGAPAAHGAAGAGQLPGAGWFPQGNE